MTHPHPTAFAHSVTGRVLVVRLVKVGDRYGRNGALTNDSTEAMVEFYDATRRSDDAYTGHLGAFTGGRYYLSTLLEGADPAVGLALNGLDNLEWTVTGESLRDALSTVAVHS